MRHVLAVVAGLIVSMLIITGLELLSGVIFPLPEGADPRDMEWLRNNMNSIPTGTLIIVAFAHLAGIIGGMFVATLISKTKMLPAYIVGALMLVATVVNLFMIPHPIWFKVTDVAGALVGLGIGKMLSIKKIRSA